MKNTLKLGKVFEVRRTALWELADSCARLYKHLYEKYAPPMEGFRST